MKNPRAERDLLLLVAFAVMGLARGPLPGMLARGQVVQGTGSLPSFEVATIKPDRAGVLPPFRIPPPNTFQNFNVTARDLVRVAYGLPPMVASTRVFGGPGWIDNDRFDVEGKIPDAVFAEMQKMPRQEQQKQKLLMIQALLKDRFKLAAHVETREMPIYALEVAKEGVKLTPAKPIQPGDDMRPPPPAPGKMPNPADLRQGLMVLPKAGKVNVMELTAKGQTLDALAQMPFFGLGMPVYNKTGLTEQYDFTLDWTPDRGAAADAAAAEDAPPLATALEEQLGLKLISTKGPVEVIVIDHIEEPTGN